MAAGHKRDASGSIVNDDGVASGESLHAPNTANSSKPTRRFECTFEGCGKSYTRAEHLGRHQLNHNPKDIYKCDFPGCTRTFVRQDLCVRHRERHDAPPNRASATLSSDDEQPDSITRRVGRPRLSSLNRAGYNNRPHENSQDAELSSRLPDAESSSAYREARLSSPATNLRAQAAVSTTLPRPQSPADYSPSHPQNSLASNINSFSIDMFNPNSTSLPNPSGYGRQTSMHNNEYAVPTLADFNESPASIRDEFTAWLFDEQFPNPSGGPFFNSSMNTFGTLGPDFITFGATPMFEDYNNDTLPPELSFDVTTSSSDFELMTQDDIAWISSSKRGRLIDLIKTRFVDAENTDISLLRHEIFGEDLDSEDHVLSLRSMQLYLGSYWKHFHQQVPILHQPTFSADAANDLLVLAVMVIGASVLSPRFGRAKTTSASRLATFLAWHLRWQIFMHADFRPPAKLWVFQALILLVIFEKQCSTRQMHERAHVHSATMINLMRRGMTLIGEDESARRTPGPTTPDEAWYRWIKTESTRRAAFAAFVIDATHAEMFGHAANMVVHELRLPLPCDDALWSATSAAEVGRVHASLHTHGIKPTTFLDGLKRTLTGKKVKTNNFGRIILMAGLLSITWHLHQRDLQISSLGASSSLGMPGIWREALAKSFDFWKRDLDESMSYMRNATLPWHQVPTSEDRDAITTAGVFHHFSHITLHIDILEIQIFAGAQKLFGRTISRSDHDRAKHKLIEWVKTSSAREAAFHALQILRPLVMSTTNPQDFYNCRNDYLLYRAWAIYYSVLVLWSYGYALDGALRPFPTHLQTQQTYPSPDLNWAAQAHTPVSESLFQARLDDARAYFTAVGAAKVPDDLLLVQTGRNRLVGVLSLFSSSFRECRWELLIEGAQRFEKAVQILRDSE